MVFYFSADDIRRWEIESQEPAGALTDVTVGDACICEGMGCYGGFADIHGHVTATWANGAKRVEPLPLGPYEQRTWLLEHRPDLIDDWEHGRDWLINQ